MIADVAVTTYQQWVAAGSPWRPATPVADLRDALWGYGFTVGVIGNVATHLDVASPEDHAPYSATPWPGPQPYPLVLAMDVMPHPEISWIDLGVQIAADRRAKVPGTEWIKYINYTDREGRCWHESWQPDRAIRVSTDRGHIHISGRTDYATSNVANDYDPVARMMGVDVALTPEEITKVANAVWNRAVLGADGKTHQAEFYLHDASEEASVARGSANDAVARLKALEARLTRLETAVADIGFAITNLGTGGVTEAALEAALRRIVRSIPEV